MSLSLVIQLWLTFGAVAIVVRLAIVATFHAVLFVDNLAQVDRSLLDELALTCQLYLTFTIKSRQLGRLLERQEAHAHPVEQDSTDLGVDTYHKLTHDTVLTKSCLEQIEVTWIHFDHESTSLLQLFHVCMSGLHVLSWLTLVKFEHLYLASKDWGSLSFDRIRLTRALVYIQRIKLS